MQTKFILHSMKWAVSVLKGPENWEMGQKAESFSKIKNKEQGIEKQEINKEQGNKYRALNWFGVWGLAD